MSLVQFIPVKAKDTRTPELTDFQSACLVNMIICMKYEADRVARVTKTYTKGLH